MAVETPRVSVITINLDGRSHLEALLESLAAQTFAASLFEVIVVDNGSTDDSLAWLSRVHPEVRVVANAANLGFARPNNQAAEIARGELLALVNNDMKLSNDWLETMVAFLDASKPEVACVGSKILNWDGSAIDFMGGTMAFSGMGFQPGYGLAVTAPAARQFPDEILFACGGAMLIRRDVYLEAGGFDEDYFAYYEDIDLGWRLWVLGHTVRFCPNAVVYHRHNGTSARFDRSGKIVLFERNAMASVLKNYDDESLRVLWPAALLLAFKRAAVRSGISRERFRFGPPPPAPPAAGEAPLSLPRRLMKNLVEGGVSATFNKLAVLAARKVLARCSRQYEVGQTTAVIEREAYASLVGMEDFIDFLPRMMAKRRDIQARRRRSDSELFALFGDPLRPLEDKNGYLGVHAQVVRELGLAAMFASVPVREGGRS